MNRENDLNNTKYEDLKEVFKEVVGKRNALVDHQNTEDIVQVHNQNNFEKGYISVPDIARQNMRNKSKASNRGSSIIVKKKRNWNYEGGKIDSYSSFKRKFTRDSSTSYVSRRRGLNYCHEDFRTAHTDLDAISTSKNWSKCHKEFMPSRIHKKPEYSIIIENEGKWNQGATHALFFSKLQKRNKKTLLRNLKLLKGKKFWFIADIDAKPYRKITKKHAERLDRHSFDWKSFDVGIKSLSIINMQHEIA
jgi:hypothetical protein